MEPNSFVIILFVGMVATAVSLPPIQGLAAYPEKPITFISSTFPRGGPVDVTARALAEAASQHLPQPLAVENRAGKAGTRVFMVDRNSLEVAPIIQAWMARLGLYT